MNQITIYAITGRTELAANEYISTKPAYEDHGPAHTLHTWRTYTIQAQEDAHLFHLTEQFWSEATERYYSDIPNDEPNHEPESCPEPSDYAPCEQQAYVSEADGWTLVTTYDLSAQPTPFKSLEIGTVFFDPFAKDMVRKISGLSGVVVASEHAEAVGVKYGYIESDITMNDTVYPVLPPNAQHLAEWIPEPLATDPSADHPEGWNAPAAPVYPLPPAADSPEPGNEGIPVTYKVAMGNCYRLYHHNRQIAICPNYAQAEVIAQALAATFAGRLSDFSLTLDFIEGASA